MKCQFTLTVSEGKRLIAKAIASLPEVRKALSDGMILLKGGTTVSALSEELCGQPLRISGRVTPRGTVSSGAAEPEGAHSLLLRRGSPKRRTEGWRRSPGKWALTTCASAAPTSSTPGEVPP